MKTGNPNNSCVSISASNMTRVNTPLMSKNRTKERLLNASVNAIPEVDFKHMSMAQFVNMNTTQNNPQHSMMKRLLQSSNRKARPVSQGSAQFFGMTPFQNRHEFKVVVNHGQLIHQHIIHEPDQ